MWPQVMNQKGPTRILNQVNIELFQKCPGSRSPIEKPDGCNHMTGKKSKFQFFDSAKRNTQNTTFDSTTALDIQECSTQVKTKSY